MASFTLKAGHLFPADSTVDAYPASNWVADQAPTGAAPKGDPEGSGAKVGTESDFTIDGLQPNTEYVAYAEVDGEHRYVRFRTRAE